MRVQSLSWEDPLEKGMATHFSILAWRILWTEEPGRYSPGEVGERGSESIGDDLVTKTNKHVRCNNNIKGKWGPHR